MGGAFGLSLSLTFLSVIISTHPVPLVSAQKHPPHPLLLSTPCGGWLINYLHWMRDRRQLPLPSFCPLLYFLLSENKNKNTLCCGPSPQPPSIFTFQYMFFSILLPPSLPFAPLEQTGSLVINIARERPCPTVSNYYFADEDISSVSVSLSLTPPPSTSIHPPFLCVSMLNHAFHFSLSLLQPCHIKAKPSSNRRGLITLHLRRSLGYKNLIYSIFPH